MGVHYQIRIEGLDEQVDAFARHDAAAKAELRLAMRTSLSRVRTEVTPNAPTWTGSMKRDWRTSIRGTGSTISGAFYNRKSFFVRMVEGGRAAGARSPMNKKSGDASMPFPEKLVWWVQQKLSPAASDLRNVTFWVARSIGRKGIKERPFVAPAWKRVEGWVQARFEVAVSTITDLLSNGRR